MMKPMLTKWSVFTGSPCSGKTEVVRELERRGFPVRHEFARAYFDQELAKGRKLKDICADQQALQRMFLEKGLEQDASLDPALPYILDRGPIDAVAHYLLYGFETREAMEKVKQFQYACVFYFEALTFIKDAVRIEDEAMAKKLDGCFRSAYEDTGYTLIHVPLASIEERTDFVVRHLNSVGIYSA